MIEVRVNLEEIKLKEGIERMKKAIKEADEKKEGVFVKRAQNPFLGGTFFFIKKVETGWYGFYTEEDLFLEEVKWEGDKCVVVDCKYENGEVVRLRLTLD